MADIGGRLTFESLTVGNAITSSDLPADWSVLGTGGALTVVSKTWDHGTKGAQFNNPTSQRDFIKSGSFGTAVGCQTVYFILDTVGTAVFYLSGGTGSANWRINLNRSVRPRNNNTAVGADSTNLLTADGTTVYRAEHSSNPAAGTQQLKIFLGDDNASPIYDSGSLALASTARTNFQFGATAAAAGFVVTVLAAWVADTAWTGPIATAPITPLLTRPMGPTPWASSHRGGAYGPEEVAYTYQQSQERSPASWWECDLQDLTDGFGCSHDDTLDRTADASSPFTTGSISALSKAQWATVKLKDLSGSGVGPQPALTLDAWVALAAGVDCGLMPEVKTGSNASAAASALIGFGVAWRTIVQAFSFANAATIAATGLETLFLMASGDSHTWAQVKAAGINHIGRNSTLWTSTDITAAKAAGLKVWVFTVDTTVDAASWYALGADAVFTNQPALLNPPAAARTSFMTAA